MKPTKNDRNKVPGLAKEYKAEFPYDEWYHEFGDELQQHIGQIPLTDRLETNHIFTNPRVDRWSNFMNLGETNHRWFHEHALSGRVLCLVVKLRKGEAEVKWYEKHRRIPSLLSLVESMEPHFENVAWMRPYWEELASRLKGIAQ